MADRAKYRQQVELLKKKHYCECTYKPFSSLQVSFMARQSCYNLRLLQNYARIVLCTLFPHIKMYDPTNAGGLAM